MSLSALQQRVEEGVQQRLLPLLFDSAKRAHKRNWKDCPCDWCAAKRHATIYLSVSPAWAIRGGGHADRRFWRDSVRPRFQRNLADLFDPLFKEEENKK